MTGAAELAERRDQALRDLADLDDQLAAGELDETTADELRRRYETEAADAMRALETAADPSASSAGRTGRWLVAASLVTVLAVVGAVTLLPRFVSARPDGGFVTGNEAVEGGRDLSQVTNEEMEQVVAENPDVVPMRLRLAHRYLDDGEARKAFEHYMAVLDRGPDTEAMSHVGWIVFEDGDVELAVELLEASLARAPGEPEALWMLANVRLYGQDDPAGALAILEELAARDDLGAQRGQIEDTITEAQRRAEGRG